MQMGPMDKGDSATSPRVLVAIASYGTSNDCYLQQIIREYRSMTFDIDIVVLSNVDKKLIPGVECVVGLPTRDPWSLPFAHKKLFADRRDRYDLFIYSEDDILITERNLRAWLDAAPLLAEDEIAGFLRVEYGSNGARSYPDVHARFHWDPSSVRRRGDYVLARFTNEHAACYVLTRQQLRRALNSGGFDVSPHEGSYDLACTAATDPYTQCGLTKLIPRLPFRSVHGPPHVQSLRWAGGRDRRRIRQADRYLASDCARRDPFAIHDADGDAGLARSLFQGLLRAGDGSGDVAHPDVGPQCALHRLRLRSHRKVAGRKGLARCCNTLRPRHCSQRGGKWRNDI